MTDQLTPPPDDPAMLAADYALGLLGPAERREAEARMERDPAFSADVRAWTELLAPLAEEAGEAAPPPGLWPRILDQLDGPYRAAND
ncbi:MAG: hypothetical protein M3M95_00740, partial [Pseudomonadota bacterium]|nr:hypothetical protein [Pseudomonadota bacterium]